MAYDFLGHIEKIEHDMVKAGYLKSAIYLQLANECKKHAEYSRSEIYFNMYKQHRDMEQQAEAKEQQQLSYNAGVVVKHFPPEIAQSNAKEFVETQPNYYACPENHKQMTDYMIAQGIAPTVDGFRKTYYTLRALGVLKENPDSQNFFGKGLAGMIGGAATAGAQEAVGGVTKALHKDTDVAHQQAQAHMLAEMQKNQQIAALVKLAYDTDMWQDSSMLIKSMGNTPAAVVTKVVVEHVGRKFREESE